MDTIGDWTPIELRRFIRGQLQNDPQGMMPPTDLTSALGLVVTSGTKIDFGTLTVTFTANPISAVTTTVHNLGKLPRIWTQPADFGALATGPLTYVGNITDSQFDCKAQDAGGVARTGSVSVYWIAIG